MPTERPGRTVTQLIEELAEETRILLNDKAHRRPRCSTCKAIIYPGIRERKTFHGPVLDTEQFCGFCAIDLETREFERWPDRESVER